MFYQKYLKNWRILILLELKKVKLKLKVGKRAISLWFKLFRYKEDGTKDFVHVKEGLTFLHKILTPYKFDVTILADRGFKSVDLFKFIDETLNWKYCIRCTKDLGISIDGKSKIKKLGDIIPAKRSTKYFYNVKLTTQEYVCNMAVCKAEDAVFLCLYSSYLLLESSGLKELIIHVGINII